MISSSIQPPSRREAVEVALCGHATLASAHVLWEAGQLARDEQARFSTQSGLLTASRRDGGWIELDFPAKREEKADPLPGLTQALRAEPNIRGEGSLPSDSPLAR
ncbi:PhzF family phenazine biosynthesis protein [Sorangium sp. So ce590]|uniref:PhzF family phenazine biosynthesis protein n=1 Tax=Sorangium sp. So ce590 TaxID=3133317 RepID=UPI003F61DE78